MASLKDFTVDELVMMMMTIALFSIQHTVHMKRVEQEVQDLYKALPVEQSSENKDRTLK